MNRARRRAGWLATHRRALREWAHPPGDPALAPAAVRLHIDELVLHGFPASARHAIAEATQTQLISLLTHHGVPARFETTCERSFVDAGIFPIAPGARPLAIGSLVAGAVYGETK